MSSNPNFRHTNGTNLVPQTSTQVSGQGDMDVDSTSTKINYHNGTSSSPVVTEAHTSQASHRLQSKDLSADNVQFVDPTDTTKTVNFSASGATSGKSTTLASSASQNRTLTLPDATDTITANAATQTLTNKTIDATSNTISNLTNSNLSGSAGITGANIASATITGAKIAATTVAGSNMVNNTVTNTQLAQMAANSIKGNNTAGTANALDLSGSQVTALLSNVVGDSGSGGTKGLVPAPSAGDAAANKFLKADGTFAAVPPSGATTVAAIDTNANSNALFISGNNISTQSASASKPGMMNTTTQTIAGLKTFQGGLVSPSVADNGAGLALSASNNQDLTLSTFATGQLKLQGSVGVAIVEQSSTPLTNPSSGYSSLYFKSDHNLYKLDPSGNETQIGSAGSGVNFVGLDTSWNPVNLSDRNAESSIGNWKAYQDTAGVAPVNMNGTVVDGSPITITRSTSAGNILNGIASFLITKPAANKQGEGVSVIANIPAGYRGQGYSIQMPFKLISGSLVQGDLKVYIYDVTNSTVITPINNDILGASGVVGASFTLPSTCTQIRVGFHFASTASAALTLSFDDVFVGPQPIVYGPAMTDWKSDLTFTYNGFGTVTNNNVYYRRVGDSMEVVGNLTTGTTIGSNAAIILPSGYTIDTTKLPSNAAGTFLGVAQTMSGSATGVYAVGSGLAVFYDGSTNNNVFIAYQTNTTFSKVATSIIMGSSTPFSFTFKIPILGWSTGIATANSTVIKLSNYLATGTRVTGSNPTALGQYRSQLRNAAAFTYTDTNGTPAILPTATDGIYLYAGGAFTSADANNNPSRYDIYIGTNKYYRIDYWAGAGHSGIINRPSIFQSGSNDLGVIEAYNPNTGILTLVTPRISGGTQVNKIGFDDNGNYIQNAYFDVTISDNPLAVQSQKVAPTIQKFLSGSGTYTTPSNPAPLYLKVTAVGGGSGGMSAINQIAGVAGGNTTFGTSLIVANGGAAPTFDPGGLGGTASISAPAIGIALTGGGGGAGHSASSVSVGGMGGATIFGGAGVGGANGSQGRDAAANTGAGGGGGGVLGNNSGSGGGSGGVVLATINNPGLSYAYAVGSGGAGGVGGGASGGAGANGLIIVEEHYQ